MQSSNHPRNQQQLTTARHQYRDVLITVAASKTNQAGCYHCFAKQLVEVLDSCGTVFILGYIPIGITTLRLAELRELFPTVSHTIVLHQELITAWQPPKSTAIS